MNLIEFIQKNGSQHNCWFGYWSFEHDEYCSWVHFATYIQENLDFQRCFAIIKVNLSPGGLSSVAYIKPRRLWVLNTFFKIIHSRLFLQHPCYYICDSLQQTGNKLQRPFWVSTLLKLAQGWKITHLSILFKDFCFSYISM